jgi:hypothetical protein
MRYCVPASLVAVGVAWFLGSVPPEPSVLAGVPISSSLEPLSWPPKRPLPVGSAARPLLFSVRSGAEESALAALPCLRLWLNATAHFRSRDVELTAWTQPRPAVKREPAEFTLARGREAEFESSRRVHTVNLSLAELWSRAADEAAENVVYHSGPVDAWGDAALTAEAAGALEALALHDAPSDVSPSHWPPSSGPIAWAGSKRVLATPHYDRSLNLVLQVVGVKRWLLWPPHAADRGWLRMHPSTHPSRRQVSVTRPHRSHLPPSCTSPPAPPAPPLPHTSP